MDDLSDTFCALPFMAVHTSPKGFFAPCCNNRHKEWPSYTSIEQYWHSSTLDTIRKNLSNGRKDSSCVSCWQMEEKNIPSLRQTVSQSRSRQTVNEIGPIIQQVKLCTGKTCNLACMMCFGTVSSTYEKTWQSDPIWIMPETKQENLTYDIAMDRYIRQHAHQLEYIEVLGGEPLFTHKFFDLLRYLIDIGASKTITLFVITNGTLFTPRMRNLFKQFKKTVLSVSVDGVGLVNDYQRWPSRWIAVEKNLSLISQDFDMSILPCVTALNIIHLPRLIDFCQSHNYHFGNIQIVNSWKQLSPSNLPEQLKKMVCDQYRTLLEGQSDSAELIRFIHHWDNQRNISIKNFLPEWQSYL